MEHFRAARVPEYRFPERAASALAILAERAEYLQRQMDEPVPCIQGDKKKAQALLEAYTSNQALQPNGFIPQEVAFQLVQAYGIPIPPSLTVKTLEEALNAASQLGYPVALKIASENILHKSDIGGVILNLNSPKAVADAFQEITAKAGQLQPEDETLEVTVQAMILGGQDIIIGVVQDAQFGPLVMFGSGGIEVEELRDIAFALAPLGREEASRLLDETWAGRKMRGYRNIPPADRQAVINAILCLSQIVLDFPAIAEIEINPLRVLGERQGVIALDVRARLRR